MVLFQHHVNWKNDQEKWLSKDLEQAGGCLFEGD
jgi:hypothetical protein